MDVTASPFCYRRSIPWDQQTRFCLQLWSEQTARPLIPMPRVLGDLLNMEILEGRNPAPFASAGSSRA